MTRRTDRVGDRYGRLVVLKYAGPYRKPNGEVGGAFWLCRCDCGTEKVVHGVLLRRGEAKSCGCLTRELASARRKKDVVDYNAMHIRIRTARGSASQHACVDCGDSAYDWSYDYQDANSIWDARAKCRYSLDIAHYAPRCRRCHLLFDSANRPAALTPLRTVRVDDQLWAAALARATERGESVSDVLRRALLDYV